MPPFQEWHLALTSDHVRLHLTIVPERPLSPRPSILGNAPRSSIQRVEIALISDHIGPNPTVTLEWQSPYI